MKDLVAVLRTKVGEAKRRGGEQDGFTPPPLTENFVSGEWDRLKQDAPALPAEKQKADLDVVFGAALAGAWSEWPQGNTFWRR